MKKMRVFPLVLLLVFLLLPVMSAEIIINQQPKEIYNLGDIVSVPVTVKATGGISGFLGMDLICGGAKVNFFRDGINIPSGEEKREEASLVLIKSIVGELKGTCKIKAYINNEYVLTNNFKISDKITVNAEISATEINPGESILVEGQAVREDGNAASGFIDASVSYGDKTLLNQSETIKEGFFSMNIDIPENTAAGAYILRLNVYELDIAGKTTNKGSSNHNIRINQVPTGLEITFDKKEVEPGTNLKVKAILHDQTGEGITSTAIITIKNRNDRIVEQADVATDEFIEFWIPENEIPGEWKVSAESGEFDADSSFKIMKKEEISIEIVNRTLTITNTGNVPYNKTALVRMGDETLNIDVYLGVGESQIYRLSAPNGNYEVEVTAGDYTVSKEVALTGKVIDIKKVSGGIGVMANPVVWGFITLLLGFVAFIVFKRGYQRSFIGYIKSKVRKKGKKSENESVSVQPFQFSKKSFIKSGNKAEFSLSIKGEKQNVNVIALNIKNTDDIRAKKSNAKETIQEIVDFAESHKATTYESNNILFFIISPTKTRTFKNEPITIAISQKIKEMLSHHNKMFKQKIDFGISLNYGTIVAKQDKTSGIFRFMSLGTLMTGAKKISSVAEKDILISEKMNDRLRPYTKTEKHEKEGISVFSIKEVKTDKEEYKKFIRKFIERQKKEKKK